MTHELLGVIWYGTLALVWGVYLSQELFVLGAGILHRFIAKNDDEIKQIQYATGLHWDGIEVWLILAVGGLFAAFPLVYAVQLSTLYIPFFLLIYAVIARGISIELIYKTDDIKIQKALSITWVISSLLMALVLGVYMANIFRGLPINSDGMTRSFIYIFNLTGLLGGIFFVALSLTFGAAWISISTKGDLGKKAFKIAKYSAFVLPWIVALIFQGFNTTDNPISVQQLYSSNPILFLIPGLTLILAIILSYFTYKEKAIPVFILSILTILGYIASGFVGSFPYMIPSTLKQEYGVSLYDGMASEKTLSLMLYAALIFVPIVIGYQSFKYIRFRAKVQIGDDK